MGLVSEILASNSRKPIFGYRAMIASILAIAFLSTIVWGHHMFISGMNPFLGSVFTFTTLLIAIPSAVKAFNWITTLWKGNLQMNPAMLFSIGFVSTFITGGLTGIILGDSALDINVHDTYFVVAHFHLVMGISALYGMFYTTSLSVCITVKNQYKILGSLPLWNGPLQWSIFTVTGQERFLMCTVGLMTIVNQDMMKISFRKMCR